MLIAKHWLKTERAILCEIRVITMNDPFDPIDYFIFEEVTKNDDEKDDWDNDDEDDEW